MRAAGQDNDLVPAGDEMPGQGAAEKAGTAGDDDLHEDIVPALALPVYWSFVIGH